MYYYTIVCYVKL